MHDTHTPYTHTHTLYTHTLYTHVTHKPYTQDTHTPYTYTLYTHMHAHAHICTQIYKYVRTHMHWSVQC